MGSAESVSFQKVFDRNLLPNNFGVAALTLDWEGEPLLLIRENREPIPPHNSPPGAIREWALSTPSALHVMHRDSGEWSTITLDELVGPLASQLQRFEDGWLVAAGRGGAAAMFDYNGKRRGSALDFGDAIEDMQTTSTGDIWVTYFDEGAYGKGMGSAGAICFDASGEPVFRYNDFARQYHLPSVFDLYAINVVNSSDIWLSYYTDFPLVRLARFSLTSQWPNFGPIRSLTVNRKQIAYAHAYKAGQWCHATLKAGNWERGDLSLLDDHGDSFEATYSTVSRRDKIALITEASVWLGTIF